MTTAISESIEPRGIHAPDPAGRNASSPLVRWLRWAVGGLWLSLMLAATVAPFGGLVVDAPLVPWVARYVEIGLLPGPGPLAPFSGEATASGIRTGDVILAVNGQRLRDDTAVPTDELNNKLQQAGPGDVVLLTTRSPAGKVSNHALTRSSTHVDELFAGRTIGRSLAGWIFLTSELVGNLALIAASVLLFRHSGRKRLPLMLSFSLLVLSLVWFGIPTIYFFGLGPWRVPVLEFNWSLLILILMLFPDGRFAQPWAKWVALALFALTPLGAFGILQTAVWVPIHALFVLIAATSLFLRYRRLPPGEQRQQLRWAQFGFSAGAMLLVPTIAVDLSPRLDMPARLVLELPLLAAISLVFAGGLVVSMLKYRLYDADRVIARSVSFGALALALVALFAGAEKVIELLGEEWFGEDLGVLAGGIGAALAALMIVPLHHRLTHWAEHRFRKQLIQLRHGLPELVGDLRETASVERIAAASLDWIMRGVHASRAALIVGDDTVSGRGIASDAVEPWRAAWTPAAHDGFDIDRGDPLFPLRVPLEADGHGRVGWLLLGPRPDGSFYGKDEREALAKVADPVARALEIAQTREKREAAELERWQGQESLNGELKAVNSELVRVLGALDAKLDLLIPAPAKPARQRSARTVSPSGGVTARS